MPYKDPEKRKAVQKAANARWRAANAEQVKAMQRIRSQRWYEKNRERALGSSKLRRQQNPVECRTRATKYYREHRLQRIAYGKARWERMSQEQRAKSRKHKSSMRLCETCDQPFPSPRGGRTKYCSRPCRSEGHAVKCPHPYSVRHDAFDTLNEESIYWAGFLMADGCIRPGSGREQARIILSLAQRDREHVLAFRSFMGFGGKVGDYVASGIKGRDGRPLWQTKVAITSNQVAAALGRLGVLPRKSHTASADLSVAMDRDFWRGVVDGDGFVAFCKDEVPSRGIRLSLVGSWALMEQFRHFVVSIAPAFAGRARRHKGVAVVGLSGRQALVVIRHLYQGCSVSLARKATAALAAISTKHAWRGS